MDDTTLAYRSFLLRIWLADNDGRPIRRFTLEPTGGGPARVFASAAALLDFLEDDGGGHRRATKTDSFRSDDG